MWRSAALDLLRKLYAEEEARRALERDYLDARAALFPETERAWARTREVAEQLARLALFLQHLADDPPPSLAEVAADAYRSEVAAAAAERAGYLADLARAQTWQLCGEAARAAGILRSRFRRIAEAATPTL